MNKKVVQLWLIFTVLLLASIIQPVAAINLYHQFPAPDGRHYLTIEVNGNLVELWMRENPNYCGYNDVFLGSLNPAVLSSSSSQNPTNPNGYYAADNAKKTIDAAQMAWDLGSCAFWATTAVGSAGAVGTAYGATLTGVGILPAAVVIPTGSLVFLVSSNNALISCSQAGSDLIVNIGQALTTENQPSTQAQFKVTSRSYIDTADLDQAVKSEFGNDYKVADWNEIKAYSGNDVQGWANSIGMNHNDYYFVTWNGQGFWNGGNRHYFITRFDGTVDPGYLVHDQIGNNLITLGSWYGDQERILAIRTSNVMPSA